MAIEKMSLVNIKGNLLDLDDVMMQCSELGCFHPEPASEILRDNHAYTALIEENPYAAMLERIVETGSAAGIPLEYHSVGTFSPQTAREEEAFLSEFRERFMQLTRRKNDLAGYIENHENVLVHLDHIEGLDLSFDDLFSCRYLKVRLGKLHQDSCQKLSYYEDEMFVFVPFGTEGDYCWGAYFTTEEYAGEVDNIFHSLFFERIWIPEYVHGYPENAIGNIQKDLEEHRRQYEEVQAQLTELVNENREHYLQLYSLVRFLSETFDMRRYVAVSRDGHERIFHVTGFVPTRMERTFCERLEAIDGVSVSLAPDTLDHRFTPPTKLRNNWFTRPFEMFVNMYGTPSHTDVDPTAFVAYTYTLLFGAMFGDVGQGLLVSLLGWLLYRKKGMPLGAVMERIGISSACFGFLYGSVFGFEHLLDPFYTQVLGLPGKPVHIMDSMTINTILGMAVGAGAVLILLSICINIVTGLRQRDWERAFFGPNSVAGLLFYGTLLCGVALQLFAGISIFTPAVIGVGIVLPALVIFFKEPLASLARGMHRITPEEGIGGYLAESFFELFEVVLSFLANTMSFLRIGGFVLSHAGMMLVVFTLSEMVGGAGSPLVIALGNLFVIGLEGLIVGIQVLRLEFYEMFSRFFEGNGTPFEPITFDEP